jgi:phosphate:Na+ symporter
LSREQAEQLHALRMAGRSIADAIKGVKHLQKNLRAHIRSPNLEIRRAYDDIPIRIATALRELEEVRTSEDPAMAVLSLDSEKVSIAEADIVANGMLDHMIREHHIEAKMATSLINDNSYAHNICTSLIEVGQTLFGEHDAALKQAEQSQQDRDSIQQEIDVIRAQRKKGLKVLKTIKQPAEQNGVS